MRSGPLAGIRCSVCRLKSHIIIIIKVTVFVKKEKYSFFFSHFLIPFFLNPFSFSLLSFLLRLFFPHYFPFPSPFPLPPPLFFDSFFFISLLFIVSAMQLSVWVKQYLMDNQFLNWRKAENKIFTPSPFHFYDLLPIHPPKWRWAGKAK